MKWQKLHQRNTRLTWMYLRIDINIKILVLVICFLCKSRLSLELCNIVHDIQPQNNPSTNIRTDNITYKRKLQNIPNNKTMCFIYRRRTTALQCSSVQLIRTAGILILGIMRRGVLEYTAKLVRKEQLYLRKWTNSSSLYSLAEAETKDWIFMCHASNTLQGRHVLWFVHLSWTTYIANSGRKVLRGSIQTVKRKTSPLGERE
jgi:hypothetical protein